MLKVLIVEDEDFERKALRFLVGKFFSDKLEIAGEASNGEEAVEKAFLIKPDVILMDINMPVMDGLQASERIKQLNKDIEIVILTAYNYFEYAKRGIKIGVSDYLLKPFSNEEFLESIDEIINKVMGRNPEEAASEELGKEEFSYEINNIKEIVEAAKRYIQANFTREISLEEIAGHVAISSFYLSRIFSKSEGMTYKDYLIKLRMERARKLLREGKKAIKEIAIEVGYIDQNYFSKAFKKYYNKSPKTFYLDKGN